MQERRWRTVDNNGESIFQLGEDNERGWGGRRDEGGGEEQEPAVDDIGPELGPEMGEQR